MRAGTPAYRQGSLKVSENFGGVRARAWRVRRRDASCTSGQSLTKRGGLVLPTFRLEVATLGGSSRTSRCASPASVAELADAEDSHSSGLCSNSCMPSGFESRLRHQSRSCGRSRPNLGPTPRIFVIHRTESSRASGFRAANGICYEIGMRVGAPAYLSRRPENAVDLTTRRVPPGGRRLRTDD